jgi:hypothetical protein
LVKPWLRALRSRANIFELIEYIVSLRQATQAARLHASATLGPKYQGVRIHAP